MNPNTNARITFNYLKMCFQKRYCTSSKLLPTKSIAQSRCIRRSFEIRRNYLSTINNLLCQTSPFSTLKVVPLADKLPESVDNGQHTNMQGSDSFDTTIVTGGDEDLEKKLKILFLEAEVLRQEGAKAPSKVTVEQWKELINMETRSKRKKFFNFLWLNEMKRQSQKRKKEDAKQMREESKLRKEIDVEDDTLPRYGLNSNTIFMRIYDTTIMQFFNAKLAQAMQFSQKIVVDCGYDPHMTPREAKNCAKQLMLLFAENRFHREPFNLYFCNAQPERKTICELVKYIPTLYNKEFPLNITDKSYLDIFPKERLVYLTPHCHTELQKFNHDDVYIIGAMVDKVNNEPLSLAKAKQEGLRMAKLPLDHYLDWGCSSGKSLTINQMISIMLDLRTTGDWANALRHVPRRKLYREERTGHRQWKDNRKKQF